MAGPDYQLLTHYRWSRIVSRKLLLIQQNVYSVTRSENNIQHRKHLSYFHKFTTIVSTVLDIVKRVKFHLSGAITSRVDLFVHVIYSGAGTVVQAFSEINKIVKLC